MGACEFRGWFVVLGGLIYLEEGMLVEDPGLGRIWYRKLCCVASVLYLIIVERGVRFKLRYLC